MANTKQRLAETVAKFHNPLGNQAKAEIRKRPRHLRTVGIRIDAALVERIKDHFEDQGLKLGQGLRQVITTWAKGQRI